MKLLIITIIDYSNYGNRLQNYALAKLLKNQLYDVTSGFELYSKEYYINCSAKVWKRWLMSALPHELYKIIKMLQENIRPNIQKKRVQRFRIFSEQYLHTLPKIFIKRNKDLAGKIPQNYDYYIAGSDQVWNPYFAGRDYEFLTFAPPEKRIAFAASFGVEQLEPDDVKRYTKLLENFAYISVREVSGAKLVKQLIGKEVDVILDPTLLLECSEWEQIVKKPSLQLPEHYILAFFLGEEPESAIECFSAEQGTPVLHMNREEYPELYVLDPAEFLYMVRHADYILTDSFHGMAFSIKFERGFYVFRRREKGVENMFTRISNILDRFGLENREQERDVIREVPPVPDWQWEKIREDLGREREKAMEKLREHLK